MTSLYSSAGLTRTTPEALGTSSAAVLAFLDALTTEGQEIHSLMIVQRGAVIAEGWWSPYAPEHPHMLYSLSKSFTSTAAGLAIAEGHFSLDDTVVSFFPDDLPTEISVNLATMRVRDLLAMATGHEKEPDRWDAIDGNWVWAFLASPVPFEPGTHFLYNSLATYMVSAIVQKTTGKDLLTYLEPRLFAPLGIASPTWENCPQGINVGGWGLSVRTEDIANFGLLYLQDGIWNGTRLLPAGWVANATAIHIANGDDPNNDWNQGYGFQFWRCQHGAYRGDGAFGQYCVVMPDQETVIAITSRVDDMGLVLKQIWNVLLPALGNAPLPDDSITHDALTSRLSSLALPTQAGNESSPIASEIAGKIYHFAPNDWAVESATFRWDGSAGTCALEIAEDTYDINFGYGKWLPGTLPFLPLNGASRPVVSSSAWTADGTLTVKVCFYETPFILKVTCQFSGDRLTLDIYGNLGFGPKESPLLEGVIAPS